MTVPFRPFLASLALATLLASGIPVPRSAIAREPDEVEDSDHDVEDREVEDREIEDHEVEDREVEDLEVEVPEIETEHETRETSESIETSQSSATAEDMADRDYGWLADAIRFEDAERDDTGAAVRRGEVVVSEISPAVLARLEAAGFRVIERRDLSALGTQMTRLGAPRGMSTREAVRQVRAAAPEATTDYDHYYGLGVAASGRPRKIRGDGIAPAEAGGFSVGMIDTGVASHPALAKVRVVAWPRGQTEGNAAAQGNGSRHGTAVASLLAGRGATTLYTANIFRGSAGRPYTSIDVIADALDWMLARDVAVINMSLAGPPNAILERLVAAATARGRTIVAAAGNGGPVAAPVYPAALPQVVAITAVNGTGQVYRYANRGAYIDFAAAGVDVPAAEAGKGIARFTGTSFAAPVAAANIARCRTAGRGASDCLARLQSGAADLGAPGFDPVYGFGLIR